MKSLYFSFKKHRQKVALVLLLIAMQLTIYENSSIQAFASASIFCPSMGYIDSYWGNFSIRGGNFFMTEFGSLGGDLVGNYTADQVGIWLDDSTMFSSGSINITTASGSMRVEWDGFTTYYPGGIETPNGTILFMFSQKGTVKEATGEYGHLVGRPLIREGYILSGSPIPSEMTMHTTRCTLTIHEGAEIMRKEVGAMKRQLMELRGEVEGLRTTAYSIGIGCFVAGAVIGIAVVYVAKRKKNEYIQ